jgi:guanine deaminase
MDSNYLFLEKACELGVISVKNNGGPFGCVIIDNNTNKIVGTGNNLVTKTFDPSAHAEIVAIRNTCQNLQTHILENCTLYTSCEPCSMCLSAIYWARINKVYYCYTREHAKEYNFDDSFIYDEVSKNIEDRKIEFVNIKIKNNNPFEEWKNKNDKVLY